MSNITHNDFSIFGLSETWIAEETEYTKIYEFEKQDFLSIYFWIREHVIFVCSLSPIYLLLVWALHKWMRNRSAFDLRRPLFLWSASLSLLSIVMFSRFFPEIIHINKKYGFYRSYCKLDHVNAASLFWFMVYIFSKILEFFDTAFIILRKQNLTFLHVFHHASVHIATVFGFIKFDPAARYFVLMNTFVHSVMYTYYALKAAKVKLPRKLSMAITTVQLLQFAVATIINILAFHAKVTGTQPSCDREDDVLLFFFVLALVYLYLFGKFFIEAYVNKLNFKQKSQ